MFTIMVSIIPPKECTFYNLYLFRFTWDPFVGISETYTIAQNARAYVFVFKANPKMCFCTKQTTYHSCTLDANILYETLYLQGYKHLMTLTLTGKL